MLNCDPADLSTQIDPKSNKRSSDDSKNESGNNSSSKEESKEDGSKEDGSKGESSKGEGPKSGKLQWSALNDLIIAALLRNATIIDAKKSFHLISFYRLGREIYFRLQQVSAQSNQDPDEVAAGAHVHAALPHRGRPDPPVRRDWAFPEAAEELADWREKGNNTFF